MFKIKIVPHEKWEIFGTLMSRFGDPIKINSQNTVGESKNHVFQKLGQNSFFNVVSEFFKHQNRVFGL